MVPQPHFLLFCDTQLSSQDATNLNLPGFGRWHFVLEQLDGTQRCEAADTEACVHRDRLALLAVVRGLEALQQPSHVTLVTTSRYVTRGLRFGLTEWRETDYNWEHFGTLRPIRNADLWQRINGAMEFHQVACRLLQSPLVGQKAEEDAGELSDQELGLFAHTASIAIPEADIGLPRVISGSARRTVQKVEQESDDQSENDSTPSGKFQRVDAPHETIIRGRKGRISLRNEVEAPEPLAFRRTKISLAVPVVCFKWWWAMWGWIKVRPKNWRTQTAWRSMAFGS